MLNRYRRHLALARSADKDATDPGVFHVKPTAAEDQGGWWETGEGTAEAWVDKLATYRGKRDPKRTPEPVPVGGPLPEGNDDTFVIQEHHARRLHWDVRLERNGVLVSWAVPKGLPLNPKTNHLAVHTEDHPLEYASFEGEIPRGEYGGGKVMIWDRGRYVLEKWTDTEVKVVFAGERATGRYVFFRIRGDDWMVHRMDPPPRSDWQPVPVGIRPMRPVAGPLPPAVEDRRWGYEMDWGGERAIMIVEGGRARVEIDGEEVTANYPELRALGPALGSRACVLDGVLVVLDDAGRPSPSRLRERRDVTAALARRLSATAPVTYLATDLLHLDGRDTTSLRYAERRELLDEFLPTSSNWHLSPMITGGEAAVVASRELGLRGVVAKRLDSTYQPGKRSDDWRSVSSRPNQQVLVCGWVPTAKPNERRRARRDSSMDDEPAAVAALIVGVRTGDGITYAGTVRAGLTASSRADLAGRLRRLARKTSPLTAGTGPEIDGVQWVRPSLVGVVSHDGLAGGGTLRRPSWLGLDDVAAATRASDPNSPSRRHPART